jgi:hypothetical protein
MMTDLNVGQTVVEREGVPVRFCFVCGARMKESWRSAEQGGQYIWYECSRTGCNQTYLIREHAQSATLFNEIDARTM